MLLIGILMLTYYLTKAYNLPQPNNCNINNYDKDISLDEVYSQKPSDIYKVMFNEPSIWQGYQQINSKQLPLNGKRQS
jgi:hypothetical protein